MKKNTKALVLGLIGAAAGVIALVVWLVVIAIGTGFYSTKIELSTVDGASEEGVQAWNKFLSASITLNYDKYYTVDGTDFMYVSSGVTDKNYTDYKNLTVETISFDQRSNGDVSFDSNTKYYSTGSQNYYLIDIDATTWAQKDVFGTIYTVKTNAVTSKPTTTISISPAESPAFWPSSFNNIEFSLQFAVEKDTDGNATRTKDLTVSVDKKGYGEVVINEFNITASFANNFTVKSVSGSVTKK